MTYSPGTKYMGYCAFALPALDLSGSTSKTQKECASREDFLALMHVALQLCDITELNASSAQVQKFEAGSTARIISLEPPGKLVPRVILLQYM